MKQYKSISELKDTAKNTLDGHYSGAILITFLSSLISMAASFVINIVAEATLTSIYYLGGTTSTATVVSFVFDLILLAASIMLGVMTAGIAFYFLKTACKQPGSVSDLFIAFRTEPQKFLVLSAVITLIQAVCLYPYQYLAQGYLNNKEESSLLYVLLAFVIGMCIYIPVSLSFSLSFFFALDFPDKSAKEVLNLCFHKMKGQRMRLFLLDLSFLPLMLLCILSFGIGFLWLEPYMQMAYTHFFLDLMNPQSE